jgi:hypothetical protein
MTLTLNYGDYHRHMTKEQWRKAISAETLAEHGNMSEMERMVLPSYRDNRMLYWAKKPLQIQALGLASCGLDATVRLGMLPMPLLWGISTDRRAS